jgi:hypothetical protein
VIGLEADIQGTGERSSALLTTVPGRTSELLIAKSTTIKGRGGRFGGRAAKAVDLILPREVCAVSRQRD